MKIIKAFSDRFRANKDLFLLLHREGEYEYRNPDSVYIHAYETFQTKGGADEYLYEHIARAEQHEWQLFRAV